MKDEVGNTGDLEVTKMYLGSVEVAKDEKNGGGN